MTSREPRVAVVGGGLAGLAAALACADAGATVTLLEARPRLGGATFSFARDGLIVDNGQHVFLRCCTAYRGFLDRIGASDKTVLQSRLDIPVLRPGRPPASIRRSRLPAPLHLAGTLARYAPLAPMDRLRVARAALALARTRPDPGLDTRTFRSWLEEHGQTATTIEALWDLIAIPTLNLSSQDASLLLAHKVFRTGLLEDRAGGDVGYAAQPLSEVHVEPAVRALGARGAHVRSRAPVRAIEVGTDPPGLVVRLDQETIEADCVILAVPHESAGALLPPGALGQVERLGGLGRSPIVNVHVVYDRRVFARPFAAGVDTPIQWVFDRTAPSGLSDGQYLAVSISAADREISERTEDLRARFVPALAELFPPAREARIVEFFVTREHAATFRQSPGTAALRPGPQTGIPRLFLAGAWTDTGWPATMEGAVRSGMAAARRALLAAGRTDRIPAEAVA